MNRLNSVIMKMVLEPKSTGPLLVGALNMPVSILGKPGCQEGLDLQNKRPVSQPDHRESRKGGGD